MPRDVSAPVYRPGLTKKQKQELAALAKKPPKAVTPVELGKLAAFALFGEPKDAGLARRVLDRAKAQREAS